MHFHSEKIEKKRETEMDADEKYIMLLDKIQGVTDAINKQLMQHETRITLLESKKNDDWKSQLLMLLAKCVVIGGVTIASLSGAGGILA